MPGGLTTHLRSHQSRVLVMRVWVALAAGGIIATVIRAGGNDGPYSVFGRHLEDVLFAVLPHSLLVLPATIALVLDSRVANKLVKIMSWLALFGVLMALQTQRSGASVKVLGAYVDDPVLPASIAVVLLVLALWTTVAINKDTLPPRADTNLQ